MPLWSIMPNVTIACAAHGICGPLTGSARVVAVCPGIEKGRSGRGEVFPVARDESESMHQSGGCEEAIHHRERDTASMACRHHVAPAQRDGLIDREDPTGKSRRQVMTEPGRESRPSAACVQKFDASLELRK